MQLDAPVCPIDRWALDPEVVHLNHGSFGGCLRGVLEEAARCRAKVEASPMRFFVLQWQAEIDRARAALAGFVRAPEAGLVFAPSATAGVATALGSLELAPGDAIAITDHTYRACRNQLARVAAARGLELIVVPVPLPFDPDALVEAFARAVAGAGGRVKLALLDHLTSPTALRLPLERLLPPLAARGVTTIVDGAHAPGQIALDVTALGATYYVGNNHKWLCAPKSSAFIATAPGAPLLPLVTSHGATAEYGPPNRLPAELDWAGTHDPSSHLAVPAAIAQIGEAAEAGGGWPAVLARNHALALELRRRFTEALGGPGSARATPLAPDDAIGTMAAIPIALPAGVAALALERRLLEDGWEVPIIDFPGGTLVRLSAHLYNHAGQAEDLARVLHGHGVRLRRL